ncbi:peptidoglycan-binding domain-containing protein [Rhodophyticola sp. CCM32]|uniref:peptidoglycan-binding domain-containing protein n=1 Tax=Rhodophyticola sp. CCM32 TaxID=2916397 RepID=UPI0026B29A25
MTLRFFLPGLLVLCACDTTAPPDISGLIAPNTVEVSRGMGPPGADPNACYGRETTPAVIETVTDQIMLQPPQISSAGHVQEPAIFVTETRQQIVRERRELWFETPCQAEIGDPAFLSDLQRALAARDLYRGRITGVMDGRTRRAIRAFQAPRVWTARSCRWPQPGSWASRSGTRRPPPARKRADLHSDRAKGLMHQIGQRVGRFIA